VKIKTTLRVHRTKAKWIEIQCLVRGRCGTQRKISHFWPTSLPPRSWAPATDETELLHASLRPHASIQSSRPDICLFFGPHTDCGPGAHSRRGLPRQWIYLHGGGESEVGRAFRTVTHSTAVSDASRDFKSAVASMRLIVKDFTASPDDTLIARFEQPHALALKGLDALAESIDHIHAETITSLRKDVLGLRENFNEHGREKPAKDLPWSRRK
jgi:hypothetical protein